MMHMMHAALLQLCSGVCPPPGSCCGPGPSLGPSPALGFPVCCGSSSWVLPPFAIAPYRSRPHAAAPREQLPASPHGRRRRGERPQRGGGVGWGGVGQAVPAARSVMGGALACRVRSAATHCMYDALGRAQRGGGRAGVTRPRGATHIPPPRVAPASPTPPRTPSSPSHTLLPRPPNTPLPLGLCAPRHPPPSPASFPPQPTDGTPLTMASALLYKIKFDYCADGTTYCLAPAATQWVPPQMGAGRVPLSFAARGGEGHPKHCCSVTCPSAASSGGGWEEHLSHGPQPHLTPHPSPLWQKPATCTWLLIFSPTHRSPAQNLKTRHRWEVETMAVDNVEYPRSVGDVVPLPNGRFLILNGDKVWPRPALLTMPMLSACSPVAICTPVV